MPDSMSARRPSFPGRAVRTAGSDNSWASTVEAVTGIQKAQQRVLQSVDRAIAELRRGACLVIHERDRAALVLAADTVSDSALAWLRATAAEPSVLLVTSRRAAALGLVAEAGAAAHSGIVALSAGTASAAALAELADPTGKPRVVGRAGLQTSAGAAGGLDGLGAAAIDLVKLARLLPAVILVEIEAAPKAAPEAAPWAAQWAAQWAAAHGLFAVGADEVAEYRFAEAHSLRIVAEARVPLANAEATRVVAFRPSDGGVEHLALVVGEPDPGAPLLTRLHSECFTGDLLASLRCDCGDQLRGAIQAIGEAGAGALLYLAQEGRGIGLVNKLRAYSLQDRGADTLEANEQLGFDADERVYLPAAEMLRQLGFRRVRLMTNNPAKVAALGRCGILVEERVPHSFPANRHNEPYLSAKARHFGHLF